MHDDRPNHTAFRAALARAHHQLIDVPPVFHDPVALRIIGRPSADELVSQGTRGGSLYLRRFERLGEPWVGFFAPEALRAEMVAMGYADIRRYDADNVNARFFATRRAGLRMRPFGAIMQARVPRRASC